MHITLWKRDRDNCLAKGAIDGDVQICGNAISVSGIL